jgi:hypothetical protein
MRDDTREPGRRAEVATNPLGDEGGIRRWNGSGRRDVAMGGAWTASSSRCGGGGGDWRGTVVVEEVVGDGGLVISCGARPFRRGEGTGDVARFPRLTRLGGAHAGRASPNSVQCNVGHTTLAHSFMIRTI